MEQDDDMSVLGGIFALTGIAVLFWLAWAVL